jgi:DNA-directed RNA polymerase specialized sigma24 family protein
MEPMNQDGSAAAPARHVTRAQLEAVYAAEYPKLVRLLVVMGATMEEAQDAAQEAMMDFFRRSRAGEAFSSPAAYVCRAAIRFFVKYRGASCNRTENGVSGSGRAELPPFTVPAQVAALLRRFVRRVRSYW